MMTTTYELVRDDVDKEFQYLRIEACWMNYQQSAILPPPFTSLVQVIYIGVKVVDFILKTIFRTSLDLRASQTLRRSQVEAANATAQEESIWTAIRRLIDESESNLADEDGWVCSQCMSSFDIKDAKQHSHVFDVHGIPHYRSLIADDLDLCPSCHHPKTYRTTRSGFIQTMISFVIFEIVAIIPALLLTAFISLANLCSRRSGGRKKSTTEKVIKAFHKLPVPGMEDSKTEELELGVSFFGQAATPGGLKRTASDMLDNDAL
jgi:hypothetical protein